MKTATTDLARVATVGLDIAKDVFCVHAVDAEGHAVLTRVVPRKNLLKFFASLPRCLIGIEACGSSHHWGRELQALGHDVRLIHPGYVKPYVKRQKNDANDAAAICEAVTRPTMPFVKVRSVASQAALVHHKVREKLVRQRTQLLNSLRGHLSEFGIIDVGRNVAALMAKVREGYPDLPDIVRAALRPLLAQIESLDRAVREADAAISRLAKSDEVASRLMTIPGVGPLTATALVATIEEPANFKGPRSLSAFIGLVPQERSSGGHVRFGGISKKGNRYLRRLLVVGAFTVLRTRSHHDDPLRRWVNKLRATKPHRLVAVAIANKLARIALALMNSGQCYRSVTA